MSVNGVQLILIHLQGMHSGIILTGCKTYIINNGLCACFGHFLYLLYPLAWKQDGKYLYFTHSTQQNCTACMIQRLVQPCGLDLSTVNKYNDLTWIWGSVTDWFNLNITTIWHCSQSKGPSLHVLSIKLMTIYLPEILTVSLRALQ